MTSAPAPVRLRSDNFTPATRTPWGGRRIRSVYKAGLDLADGDPIVGESWEISVEPSFPSASAGGETLAEIVAAAPVAWLGREVAERHDGQTPLLVKLLDAADSLSVQVHPEDGDPALAEGESGKPEAWIILDAEPGAGLYLGFREGVTREDVAACIAEGGALDAKMNFVHVASGDAFVIAAGTPHAIGKGVSLIEPQFVAPGRRGLTYRFWDWNRRYDASGNPDPQGAPRALHIERSLDVTSWSSPRGEAFVATCRSPARVLEEGPLERSAVIAWPWFTVERFAGTGALGLPAFGTMLAVTCVEGSVHLSCATGALALSAGQSGVVPAVGGSIKIQGTETLAFVVRSPV